MTKLYEIMVIVDNDRNEAEAKAFVKDTVLSKMKELKAKVTFEDFWGSRGFAYKINHKTWGYYFVAQFEAESEAVVTMTKDFNITKGIVRFLITKVDKKAGEPKTYADMKRGWEQVKEDEAISDAQSEEVEMTLPPRPKTAAEKALDNAVDAAMQNL